jgi:ABC-type dipeptide/oligopeptide/nickel transport system permease component
MVMNSKTCFRSQTRDKNVRQMRIGIPLDNGYDLYIVPVSLSYLIFSFYKLIYNLTLSLIYFYSTQKYFFNLNKSFKSSKPFYERGLNYFHHKKQRKYNYFILQSQKFCKIWSNFLKITAKICFFDSIMYFSIWII